MASLDQTPYFAAIDLGSNSFHLLVVKINEGMIEKIDRVKEMVQIARGLNNHQLSSDAQARAITCLERFHERIRDIPDKQVRVVGTKALRSANNARSFLQQAEQALGHKIDIISGYEEARLVYLGVSHDISEDKGQRLVIDIGGGSTEFIIGKGEHTFQMESLSIGCVTFSDRYFSKDENDAPEKITSEMIWQTYYATRMELEHITRAYLNTGWDISVGSSGTMRAIAQLMQEDVVTGIITKAGLNQLVNQLHNEGTLGELKDIPAKRRNVLPAGIIILAAIFDQLEIEEIHVVDSALKEGLIYDTIGRITNDDIRTNTIARMMKQYTIDTEQAQRVNNTLSEFVNRLPSPMAYGISVQKLLHWAAQLHEIGLSISHTGHHHHGHYLIQQSDMAGFSRFEQELLALLVGSHRRKIHQEKLTLFTAENQQMLHPLLACLRIAVLLNQRREDNIELPRLMVQRYDNDTLEIYLTFAENWLDEHPLTQHNLTQEQRHLAPLNINLHFV